MYPRFLALVLAAWCVSARAADLIPIEDFARLPKYSDAQLSPDGECCAWLHTLDGRIVIEFAEVNGSGVVKFDANQTKNVDGRRDVNWYRWLGSKRVLVGVSDGTATVDRNGSNWSPVSGRLANNGGFIVGGGSIGLGRQTFGSGAAMPGMQGAPSMYRSGLPATVAGGGMPSVGRILHCFNDDVNVLMPDRGDVISLNTQTGQFYTVASNPGNVVNWFSDRQGVVRLGVEKDSLIYREREKSPWRPLSLQPSSSTEVPLPQSFTGDGKAAYVSATNASGFRAIYLLDFATGKLGEPLLEVPGYDVGFNAGVIWSDQKKAMVGYSYATEGPQVKWFDETFAQHMAIINRMLPDTFNLPIGYSEQDRRLLILSSSDRNPGAYFLYSTDEKKLSALVRARPWIKPEQMASMNPITYTARDGVEIHGYLTLPQGQKPKNLPLVVLPHDGPFPFRDKWGFDPLVQLLASRGYAVLQMNYRGSPGYGAAFAQKGQREIGGAIQQDIEDATRWAITKKVADPQRIAILGGSRFGGYSALYAMGKSPDLYRCGISNTGVIDWFEGFKRLNDPSNRFRRESWTRAAGDLDKGEEKLKAISPVNFVDEITAPILFIHNEGDRGVPLEGVKKMMKALEVAGHKPESLFIAGAEGNVFAREKARIAEYKAIEAFLAKYLGAAK